MILCHGRLGLLTFGAFCVVYVKLKRAALVEGPFTVPIGQTIRSSKRGKPPLPYRRRRKLVFYVNGCFLVEGVREGQSLQAGTTNKRTLAWLCRRLPSASCLPLGRHLGLLLFSGACRRAAFSPRLPPVCGDRLRAVQARGSVGSRRGSFGPGRRSR